MIESIHDAPLGLQETIDDSETLFLLLNRSGAGPLLEEHAPVIMKAFYALVEEEEPRLVQFRLYLVMTAILALPAAHLGTRLLAVVQMLHAKLSDGMPTITRVA